MKKDDLLDLLLSRETRDQIVRYYQKYPKEAKVLLTSMRECVNVYISGPITGYDLVERKCAFMSAAEKIRRQGYTPVNPLQDITADAKQDGKSHKEYMKRDLKMLLGCNAICFLKGWQLSTGCRIECFVAQSCGIPAWDIENEKMTELPSSEISLLLD